MSYDYGKNKKKPVRKNQKTRGKSSIPGWVIFLSGAAFSLFGQFLFHLATMDTPVQTTSQSNGATSEIEEPAFKKPTINFYNQLKTMEVKVPGEETRPSKTSNSTLAIEKSPLPSTSPKTEDVKDTPEVTTVTKPEITNKPAEKPVEKAEVKNAYPYYLQAGSFKKKADAEEHRAKLSMMGMKTSIETKAGTDGVTWNRIIIGPFSSATELNRARSTLNSNSVPTMTIKR